MTDYPRDMTREQLIQLVADLQLGALDVAQQLAFTSDLMKPELRAESYKQAEWMAYGLTGLGHQREDGAAR